MNKRFKKKNKRGSNHRRSSESCSKVSNPISAAEKLICSGNVIEGWSLLWQNRKKLTQKQTNECHDLGKSIFVDLEENPSKLDKLKLDNQVLVSLLYGLKGLVSENLQSSELSRSILLRVYEQNGCKEVKKFLQCFSASPQSLFIDQMKLQWRSQESFDCAKKEAGLLLSAAATYLIALDENEHFSEYLDCFISEILAQLKLKGTLKSELPLLASYLPSQAQVLKLMVESGEAFPQNVLLSPDALKHIPPTSSLATEYSDYFREKAKSRVSYVPYFDPRGIAALEAIASDSPISVMQAAGFKEVLEYCKGKQFEVPLVDKLIEVSLREFTQTDGDFFLSYIENSGYFRSTERKPLSPQFILELCDNPELLDGPLPKGLTDELVMGLLKKVQTMARGCELSKMSFLLAQMIFDILVFAEKALYLEFKASTYLDKLRRLERVLFVEEDGFVEGLNLFLLANGSADYQNTLVETCLDCMDIMGGKSFPDEWDQMSFSLHDLKDLILEKFSQSPDCALENPDELFQGEAFKVGDICAALVRIANLEGYQPVSFDQLLEESTQRVSKRTKMKEDLPERMQVHSGVESRAFKLNPFKVLGVSYSINQNEVMPAVMKALREKPQMQREIQVSRMEVLDPQKYLIHRFFHGLECLSDPRVPSIGQGPLSKSDQSELRPC